MKHLENIQNLSRRHKDPKRPSAFSNIIIHNRHREATNELDHVFGMIGLLPGSQNIVDFTRTPLEIYQCRALYDVTKNESLDILSQIIVPDGTPVQDIRVKDLPSWAPN
jgi:hypothetical protein